jgi:hypothetical protein
MARPATNRASLGHRGDKTARKEYTSADSPVSLLTGVPPPRLDDAVSMAHEHWPQQTRQAHRDTEGHGARAHHGQKTQEKTSAAGTTTFNTDGTDAPSSTTASNGAVQPKMSREMSEQRLYPGAAGLCQGVRVPCCRGEKPKSVLGWFFWTRGRGVPRSRFLTVRSEIFFYENLARKTCRSLPCWTP